MAACYHMCNPVEGILVMLNSENVTNRWTEWGFHDIWSSIDIACIIFWRGVKSLPWPPWIRPWSSITYLCKWNAVFIMITTQTKFTFLCFRCYQWCTLNYLCQNTLNKNFFFVADDPKILSLCWFNSSMCETLNKNLLFVADDPKILSLCWVNSSMYEKTSYEWCINWQLSNLIGCTWFS